MTPADVGRAYDGLAHIWDGDGFDRRNGVAQHERAIAFAAAGGAALDVGCGCSGRFVDLLQARGFAVEGVDVSARMIERARRRHPEVTFHHADIRTWEPPRAFDFITAWDSLWHVPLADHAATLMRLLTSLGSRGVLIFTMGGRDGPEEKTDATMGPELTYSTLGIPETLQVIDRAGAILRHLEFDQWPEPHVFVIAQRRD